MNLTVVRCKADQVIRHKTDSHGCTHYFCGNKACPQNLQVLECKNNEVLSHKVDAGGCPAYFCEDRKAKGGAKELPNVLFILVILVAIIALGTTVR